MLQGAGRSEGYNVFLISCWPLASACRCPCSKRCHAAAIYHNFIACNWSASQDTFPWFCQKLHCCKNDWSPRLQARVEVGDEHLFHITNYLSIKSLLGLPYTTYFKIVDRVRLWNASKKDLQKSQSGICILLTKYFAKYRHRIDVQQISCYYRLSMKIAF